MFCASTERSVGSTSDGVHGFWESRNKEFRNLYRSCSVMSILHGQCLLSVLRYLTSTDGIRKVFDFDKKCCPYEGSVFDN